jgi:mono/diheme cytochrome c family protein
LPRRRLRRFLWLVAIVATGASGVSVSSAQNAKSVWSGVYSEAQATAGETLYGEHCTKCHGEDLAGVEQAPALAGDAFGQRWHGANLKKLFERIEVMPPKEPKSLTEKQYAEILAFLLSANEFPAGRTPLVPDRTALAEITITSVRPKEPGGMDDAARRLRN